MSDGHQQGRTAPDLGWLRYVGWGGAGLLLLLPLAAMTLAPASGVNWSIGDFIFAALAFGAVGLALEIAVRASDNWWYRSGAVTGLAAGFCLFWSNIAVGYIGEDTVYNLVFFGIVVGAALGAILVRLRARGMALVTLAAGIAHAITGALGYPADPVTGPITVVFTALWLTSATLFHKAARQGATR